MMIDDDIVLFCFVLRPWIGSYTCYGAIEIIAIIIIIIIIIKCDVG